MNRPQETRLAVYIVSGSVFFGTIASCLRWGFQAFQVMEYDALYIIILSLLRLTLGLAILIAGYGVVFFALGDLVANIVLLVGIILTATRKFGWLPHMSWKINFWKRLLKESYPLGLMLVFATIYLNNGQVMLSMLVSDAATGWYNAANKLVGFIRFLPAVFIPAIYPVMSESFVFSRDRFVTIIQQSLRLLLILGFPITVYLTVFSDKVILLIYGTSFINSIQPFRLLIWSVLFMFVSSVLGYSLISAGKQKTNATITGIGMVLNIMLNLVLIPRYSAIGASMSLLIVEAIVALLAILLMHKKALLEGNILKPLSWLPFAALAMGCTLYSLKGSMIVAAFLGISVYALVLILTKSLSKVDYQLISKLITLRR